MELVLLLRQELPMVAVLLIHFKWLFMAVLQVEEVSHLMIYTYLIFVTESKWHNG